MSAAHQLDSQLSPCWFLQVEWLYFSLPRLCQTLKRSIQVWPQKQHYVLPPLLEKVFSQHLTFPIVLSNSYWVVRHKQSLFYYICHSTFQSTRHSYSSNFFVFLKLQPTLALALIAGLNVKKSPVPGSLSIVKYNQ